MSNKINRSHLLVIVAALCLIISGCLGGETMSDLPDCETLYGAGIWTNCQGTYSDGGDRYVGEFKDDRYNGYGWLYYASGDQYVGEWKDGMRNGQGTFTYADGTQFEGIWEEDGFLYENKV